MAALGFIKSWLSGNRRASITIRGDQPATADNFNAPGDDSQALPGDAIIMVPLSDRGSRIIIASVDANNTSKAKPGEKRLYSRSEGGEIVAELWLKGDGSVELSNEDGAIELAPSGTVTINGMVIDSSGNISTPGTIKAGPLGAVVSLAGHIHNSPAGPTTPPTVPEPGA